MSPARIIVAEITGPRPLVCRAHPGRPGTGRPLRRDFLVGNTSGHRTGDP
ncbi:hypothetical protein [Catellatospora paridis]|nr:hypothetical protein [Catellatospora paridis]